LFATFLTAGAFGFAAVAFVVLVAATFFAPAFTDAAGFFALAADERAGAGLAALTGLALVAEFLTVFLVVAMDRSTIGS
jgi:hypothetical protein